MDDESNQFPKSCVLSVILSLNENNASEITESFLIKNSLLACNN